MSQLPTGTVTLLFSDMEGSTRMVHALGSAWAGVLERQREICRNAWVAQGGRELGTEGDSFMVVFDTADAAVAAALEAQRAVLAEAWPDGVTVRVRMGIHTGSPQRHADGYVGMDVHRAARVAGSAHGGQILVSEATAGLVEASLPPGVQLVDLGEHQLKDIPSRMRIRQVTAPGLPSSFPPIKSLGTAGGLPTHLVRVVGREEELSELRTLVTDGTRLVTLTGPGGTGKTRLATALAAGVADLFPDGIYVVRLAGVTAASGIWSAVSQVLDVPPDGQVPPGFFTYVANKRVLLVLDNLEQIEDSDNVVRELLESAGHVVVVATSRRPLHIDGEHEYAVTPLPPAAAQELFAQHATRVRRGFALTPDNTPDVAAICAALDGLPLAIELAAARSKLLSPKAILARIDQALDLATTDRSRDPRQATIRGAIAWSYDLLDPTHQAVLDHLGVFVGGASYEAIQAVVPADTIAGHDLADLLFDLVDASLVTVHDTDDGEPRFGLLETVRRFSLDRLQATGQHETAVAAHAQYFYDLVRPLYTMWLTAYAAGRQVFVTELANIAAMVEREPRTIAHPAAYPDNAVPVAHVVALVSTVAWTYNRQGEAQTWCRGGLRLADLGDDAAGRLGLLTQSAYLHFFSAENEECLRLCGQVWEEFDPQASDDRLLPEWARPVDVTAQACGVAGYTAADMEDLAVADMWRDRLASLQDRHLSGVSATRLAELDGQIARRKGDLVAAYGHYLELAHHFKEMGWANLWVHNNNLADLEFRMGDGAAALQRLADASEETIASNDSRTLIISAENMAEFAAADHPLLCARVFACTATARVVEGVPSTESDLVEDERILAAARGLVDPADWDAAWELGKNEDLVDLLREMAALPIPDQARSNALRRS